MNQDISGLKEQLGQLSEAHSSGALTDEQFEHDKALLERRILDDGTSLDGEPMVGVAVAKDDVATQPASATGSGLGLRMGFSLAIALLVIAVAGYWWLRPSLVVNASLPSAPTAASPHANSSEQLGTMVDKLAARLKDNPDDAAGWAMLARSYGAMSRIPEAVDAYARAVALSKEDGGLLVDYADALAVKNNRSLTGEPMSLIERALKLNPRNVKALAMAGTDAFDRRDYVAAVKFWEQVSEYGGADNLFAQAIQPSLVQARQLAGLPASKLQASSNLGLSVPGAVPAKAASAPATIGHLSGTVTLAPALAREVKPEDTVFIFARAAEGSRMPLAILRKQVKDLPVQFTLDDGMSMSSAGNLTNAGRVIVAARVSKSGQAIPGKGDLFGQSEPVTVGAKDLKIEIRDVVKQ
jgi:cytochrome c-type biogenesis protein CcmH